MQIREYVRPLKTHMSSSLVLLFHNNTSLGRHPVSGNRIMVENDQKLKKVVKLYYKASPTLVRWFGNKNWFRKPIKSILDRKINKLKKKGYDDTPYIDKY